ncbi:helix-turn-helix domain-containing protein [Rhodococcus sp. IEGM 1366]|uniref:helix-turn-helix domain-containing protein n=1 Tax=Rhodococcus sp. IEGM 1366 TaxID=3082223 RepID=UPI002952DEC7|nr:helix-turn-helix domain-containing protein [Rhodococcus sp. IEGM 1366]MDV8070943.1 helix-turn-helix domain-containing protein [Rhodococcus sp. IEGM 1366]
MSDAATNSTRDRFLHGDLPFEGALKEVTGTDLDRSHLWQILEGLASERSATTPVLSAHDAHILDDAGLVADPVPAASARVDRDIRMQNLVHESLSIPETAERLGVTPARIRQLLTEHKLWAFASGRHRLLPPAQFTSTGQVPHLDRIVPLLEGDMHPLSVQALLTTPQQSLIVEGEPVSIVAWLTGCAGTEDDISQAADVITSAQWASA